MKFIPVNGLLIDNSFNIDWFDINGEIIEFKFLTKDEFRSYLSVLINTPKEDEYDFVVGIQSQHHNSYEIQAIKSIISLVCITDRIVKKIGRMKFLEKEIDLCKDDFVKNLLKKDIKEKEGFWKDERLYEGYFDDKNQIVVDVWDINIGNSGVNNNCFERWATRYFDFNSIEEYNIQKKTYFKPKTLNITQEHIEMYNEILKLIHSGKEIYRKIRSVSYLYFEVLDLYKNSNMSVMMIATILETLLLNKNEDNQRKKVSARSACIIADGLCLKRKTYIANAVFHFYEYRNCIIHDGKNYLELPDGEGTFDRLISKIKHIIFYIIKYYVENKIETIKDVKSIVERNVKEDELTSAFDYITIEGQKIINVYDFLICLD